MLELFVCFSVFVFVFIDFSVLMINGRQLRIGVISQSKINIISYYSDGYAFVINWFSIWARLYIVIDNGNEQQTDTMSTIGHVVV